MPDEIDNTAKHDMVTFTHELRQGLKLRWADTNPQACNILEKVMAWDKIHTDLRVHLLGCS